MTRPPWINAGFQVEKKGETPSLVTQVHGNVSIVLGNPNDHAERLKAPVPADAVVSEAGVPEVYVFTADCLPVLLYQEEPKRRVAAIHAGWRGAKLGIVAEVARRMGGRNLSAIFGPCLKPCCFEVRGDFVDEMRAARQPVQRFLWKRRNGLFFDLPRFVIETQLTMISEEHLDLSENHCTFCSTPALPSFRRNGGTDPRVRAWIRALPDNS